MSGAISRALFFLAVLSLSDTASGRGALAGRRAAPPLPVAVAAETDSAHGFLLWSDERSVALRTCSGERVFPWSSLKPFSAWRIRSVLAGSDAARRVELAQYCRDQRLWSQARWEYAAARALDPSLSIPDLNDLLRRTAEEFLPGASTASFEEMRKKLEKESVESAAATKAEQHRRLEELKAAQRVGDIRTLVWKGHPSRRLDVVFLSDGYAASEQTAFNTLVDRLVRAILKVEPLANYPSYINFHRINLVEETSGVEGKKTVLGSRVDSSILTCNRAKAREVAKLAPGSDLICVIANVRGARSTGGGGILTLDGSGDVGNVAIHELGHAFAGLDDEYVDASVADRHPDWSGKAELFHHNTTREKDPKKVKWHYWNWPPSPKGPLVGAFEGAYYRDKGYYRPSQECRMKSSGSSFCVVCFEKMEKSLYSLVAPIDSAFPAAPSVRLFLDDEIAFSANAVVTEGAGASLGSLKAMWYVDGVPSDRVTSKDKTTTVKVRGSDLKPGHHEIALRVEFLNQRIRRDNGVLSGHRVWQVEVYPFSKPRLSFSGDATKGTLAGKRDGGAGNSEVTMVLLEGPPGAALDGSGNLVFPPHDALTGSVRLRIGFLDNRGDLLTVEERLVALPRKDARNFKPLVRLPAELEGSEGRPFYHRIEAWDPDGDRLSFAITGLPEGAFFDSSTGEIAWIPGVSDGGRYDGIKCTVSDGRESTTVGTSLTVLDKPLPKPSQLQGFDILPALRSGSVATRSQALKELARYGATFRLLEYLRLLRDADPGIAASALQGLEQLLEGTGERFDPRRHALLVRDVEIHLYHFTDAPKILAFLDRVAAVAEKGPDSTARLKAAKVRKVLKEIAAYNKSRGL